MKIVLKKILIERNEWQKDRWLNSLLVEKSQLIFAVDKTLLPNRISLGIYSWNTGEGLKNMNRSRKANWINRPSIKKECPQNENQL